MDGGTCKTEIDYTWTQDTTGNSYLSLWYSTLEPGQSYAIQTSATQSMDIHGNVTGVTSNNYPSTGGGWHYSGYSYLSSSNYTSRYIFNRLSSTLIQDPSNVLTMATITYDCGYGCIGSGSSPTPREWDTAYTSIGYRGNATTVATLSGTSTAVYDLYGNTASGTSPSGVGSSITTTSATNYAAPVQVTVGGSLTTNLSYSNSFLGLTNETGPNGTSVSLGYDASARPNSSTSPFGASTYTIYNDTASPPNTCTIIDGRWTQTNLDGLGRPILSLTGYGSSCGSGTTLTQAETTYDSCGCSPLGKLKTQAVPHAYGTSTSTTAITTYTYDGIGRTLSKAVVGAGSTPDTQGTTTYSYQGNTVTVTDPAGKWKTFTTDGYGNLVQVTEPNPAGGSNFTTSYTYDLLKRLIGVSMPRFTGTQTRSWTYSGAFLTSATNPENGTVSYTYGSNNHVATRTDAKGQVVTYTYDSLARLSKVQRYPTGLGNSPDACQEEDYYYNGSNPLGSSYPLYAQGRLSAVQYWGGHNASASPTCDTTLTEMYTYGIPGAPTGKQLVATRTLTPYSNSNQTQPMSLTWNATYTYDSEGRTTAETYPTDNNGATASLSYTFDQMGRLNAMTDNIAMQTIIAGTTYGPANEITSITGASGGWSGETLGYNSLKQLTSLSSGGGLNLSYSYPTTGNNGKIQSQTDAISGEAVTYTYDSLNRLATAENQTGFSPSWGQSFTYDGFGNLTGTSVIKGSAPTMAATYDVNNHAGGEDANGNPGYVPAPAQVTGASAVYDVENRLGTVSEGYTLLMNYSYAPGNKRVWRGNGGSTDEVTFYSVSGRKLGCYQITFTQGTTGYYYTAPQFYYTQTGGVNLYFGGKLIKNKNGWVYPDRLGSIGKYYPYGIERPSATTNDTEKFTGYVRDAETGNDYAVNRYESPGTGRFLTSDPSSASNALTQPGNWNRYAYVGGDPINKTDPLGLCSPEDDPPCYSTTGTGEADPIDLINSDCMGPYCYLIDTPGSAVNTNCFAVVGLQPTDPELTNPSFQGCFSAGPAPPPPPPCPTLNGVGSIPAASSIIAGEVNAALNESQILIKQAYQMAQHGEDAQNIYDGAMDQWLYSQFREGGIFDIKNQPNLPSGASQGDLKNLGNIGYGAVMYALGFSYYTAQNAAGIYQRFVLKHDSDGIPVFRWPYGDSRPDASFIGQGFDYQKAINAGCSN